MYNMNFKVLGSIIIVGVFLFFAYGSDDTKTDQVSNNTVDCSNYKGQYSSGYSSGSMCSVMGDYSSCESFVEKYNYETGRDILEASDCYCEGFNDGKDGKTKKYSSDSDESNSNSERDYSSNEENTSESSNSTYENYSESNEYQQEESQNTSDLSDDNEIEEKLNDKNENSQVIEIKPIYKVGDLVDIENEGPGKIYQVIKIEKKYLYKVTDHRDILMKNLIPEEKLSFMTGG